MAVSRDLLLEFFEKMLLIRRFEETLFDLAKRGIVKGSVHLCNGQEAPAVAACCAVDKEDFMMPTHRGHGQILAKGADPGRFLAELLGRVDGYCGGRVGSMHTFDKETNNVGSNGIVGGQFPIAAGIGLGIKLMELDRCFLLFFGDGSTNQGWFYELLNLASLWSLPIMFVCVNNKYGMGTHYDRTSNISVSGKAELFHIPVGQAHGNDVEEVYETIVPLVAQVKQEKQPVLL